MDSPYMLFLPLGTIFGVVFLCILYKSVSIVSRYQTVRQSCILLALYTVLNIALFNDTAAYLYIAFTTLTYDPPETVMGLIADTFSPIVVYVFLACLTQRMARTSENCTLFRALHCGCWLVLCVVVTLYLVANLMNIFDWLDVSISSKITSGVCFGSFLYVAGIFIAVTYEIRVATGMFLMSHDRFLSLFFICKMCGMLEGSLAYVAMGYYGNLFESNFWFLVTYQYTYETFDQLVPGVLIFAMISREVQLRRGARVSDGSVSSASSLSRKKDPRNSALESLNGSSSIV